MLKSFSKLILTSLSLLSIIVGVGGCMHALKAESTPKPISKSNIPRRFDIIGFTDSDSPVLLEHEISLRDGRKHYASEAEFRRSCGAGALWSEDCNNSRKYSFYIDANRKEDVERVLTAALNDDGQSVTIKILEDHPSARKQKVYIDFWNDDFNYYSVYAVDNRSVTPLEYGDLLKSDGIVGLGSGLKYMILFYIVGRIAFAVAVRYESRKQQQM
jgi:hypothetical protein